MNFPSVQCEASAVARCRAHSNIVVRRVLFRRYGAASLFGWVLTTTRVTEYTTEALLALTDNLPIATRLGVDPVHFGLIITLNLMIGLLHPPLGMVLFVLSRVAKLSIERTTMAILPWLIPLLLSLIAITMIPELTLWLPRVVGMIK